MDTNFADAHEFAAWFGLPAEPYFGLEPMTDRRLGFVVFRHYPERGLRYQPPLTDDGKPAMVVLIQVSLPEDQDEESSKRPLYARAMVWPLGQKTRDSVRDKATWEPIDLRFANDFWMQGDSRKITDERGRVLTGRETLERIYETHCGTSRLVPGLWFRTKIITRKAVGHLLGWIATAIVLLLEKILGQVVQSSGDRFSAVMTGEVKRVEQDANAVPDSQDSVLAKKKTLSIFGYEAPRAVIVTFSIVCLMTYFTAFFALDRAGLAVRVLKGISANPVLSIACGILGVFVLDYAIPELGIRLVNSLRRRRIILLFGEVNV